MADQSNAIEMILQDCLEKIQNGQSTLDAVLAEHPDLAEDLRPALEAALWFRMHKATLDPRPGFIAASNHRVIDQIKQEQLARAQSQPAAGENGFTWFWKLLTGKYRYAFQAALVFVLLFGMVAGSSGVVSAAQEALPGDFLYRVKTSLENAEMAFAQGEAAKAELQIRLARRRLAEIQALIAQDHLGEIPKTITQFEDHINQAIHHMIAVREKDQDRATALAASMQSLLQEQVVIFNQLAENAPPSLREMIDRIILVSSGVIGLASETVVDPGLPSLVANTVVPQTTPLPLITLLPASSTQVLLTPAPTSTLPYYELLPTSIELVIIDPDSTPTPTPVVTVVADGDEDEEDKDKVDKVKDKDKDLPDPPNRPINPPGLNK